MLVVKRGSGRSGAAKEFDVLGKTTPVARIDELLPENWKPAEALAFSTVRNLLDRENQRTAWFVRW